MNHGRNIAGLCVAMVACLASAASAQTWDIEVVENGKAIWDRPMTDRSLRLDAAGHPHIAYGGDRLYHAWFDGADWRYETADASSGVGQYAALALDAAGYAHISYYDVANEDLEYAYQDASGWHTESVHTQGNVGRGTSIALDSSGYPHISYVRMVSFTTGGLWYARKDAGGWRLEEADAIAPGDSPGSSLALDSSGYPRVGYYCANGGLKYAYRDAAGWHIQSVGVGGVGGSASLSLTGADHPCISYIRGSDGSLRYAYFNDTGWHLQTVDVPGSWAGYTSLGLDPTGNPHISYCGGATPGGGELRHAYQGVSGWQIETVDAETDMRVGTYCALAMDPSGFAHVSYFSEDTGELRSAHQDGSGWHLQLVDVSGSAGNFTSLALDPSGYPHMSHWIHGSQGILRYAYLDGAGWHAQTADVQEELGGYEGSALALDGSSHPHISYRDNGPGYDGDLKHAYRDASGWHFQTVDTEGNLGWESALALDSGDNPHISYYDYTNGNLKYAHRNGTGWHVEVAASQGNVGRYSSLELDSYGYPHISHHDYVAGDLKYTYKDAAGWHSETVDTQGNVGVETSLELDSSNHPHIAYCDWNNGSPNNVKYAYKDSRGWHIETPDPLGSVARSTTLALDAAGDPHIGYYDDLFGIGDGDLMYARRDAAGWRLQAVDAEGNVGAYPSLVVDSYGRPHISYQDVANGDLKYAHVPAPPSLVLGGELIDGQLQLTWGTVTQAAAYWVYGASNLPWFVPGGSPGYEYRIEVLPQGATTWSSAAGVGDPSVNWTYLVMAVNALNLEVNRSNRAGEQDYQGDIPNQGGTQ